MKDEQNDDLNELTAGYLDGTLNEEQLARFERHLREDSAALARVGDAVRFDVELRDAMNPDHIELIEQRRMVIDRVTGKPVLVETSQRVAQRGEWQQQQETGKRKKKHGWLLILALLLVAGILAWWLTRKPPVQPPAAHASHDTQWVAIPVRNADFEKPVMTPHGALDYAVMPGWQDKFTTHNARLTNQEAHSGSIAAYLRPGGHIKQLLERSDGVPLNFEPGMKLRVSGWVKQVKGDVEKHNALRADLHFVDEKMRQYAVTYDLMAFSGNDWQVFQVELTVPNQEKYLPAWDGDHTKEEAQKVRGRQVLLSLFNDTAFKSFATDLLIDDVKVEVLPATMGK